MTRLTATARCAVGAPEELLRRLSQTLAEDSADVRSDGGRHVVVFPYGDARLDVRDGAMILDAGADDPTSLAYVKGGLAHRVQALLGEGEPGLVWTGDGCDRRLPHLRQMRVVAASMVTPRMRRLRLAGEDLARFATGGLHVRLLVPPRGREPVWPHAGPAALPVWPEGEDRLTVRTYTIRRIDVAAGLVDIDIALHDAPGPGSAYAVAAEPGDVVGMMGPGGAGVEACPSVLLAGDETALPGIARILETLASDVRGTALIEVADADERQDLAAPAGVGIRWLLRNGREAGRSGLIEAAVAGLERPESGSLFAWSGTEFSTFKVLRRTFRKDWGLARDRHLAMTFWRRGLAEGGGTG